MTELIPISDYTEVDSGGYLAEADNRITMSGLPQNVDSYWYYDYGVDNFNAIDLDFFVFVDDSSQAGANSLGVCGFTVSTVNDAAAWGTSDIEVALQARMGLSIASIYLFRGAQVALDSYDGSLDTVYYLTLSRSADSDSVSVLIYSDSARTTLLDTLTVTGYGTGTKYRYHYAASSYNQPSTGRALDGYFDWSESISGVVGNFFIFF